MEPRLNCLIIRAV